MRELKGEVDALGATLHGAIAALGQDAASFEERLVATVEERVQKLEQKFDQKLEQKFDGHVGKFDGHVGKFDAHVGKFDAHVGKFDEHVGKFDARLAQLEQNFDGCVEKFDGCVEKFAGLEQKFDGRLEQKFDARLADIADLFAGFERKIAGLEQKIAEMVHKNEEVARERAIFEEKTASRLADLQAKSERDPYDLANQPPLYSDASDSASLSARVEALEKRPDLNQEARLAFVEAIQARAESCFSNFFAVSAPPMTTTTANACELQQLQASVAALTTFHEERMAEYVKAAVDHNSGRWAHSSIEYLSRAQIVQYCDLTEGQDLGEIHVRGFWDETLRHCLKHFPVAQAKIETFLGISLSQLRESQALFRGYCRRYLGIADVKFFADGDQRFDRVPTPFRAPVDLKELNAKVTPRPKVVSNVAKYKATEAEMEMSYARDERTRYEQAENGYARLGGGESGEKRRKTTSEGK